MEAERSIARTISTPLDTRELVLLSNWGLDSVKARQERDPILRSWIIILE
jgi:hypothetical protein